MLGSSFGGDVALTYAGLFPDHPGGVILANTNGGRRDERRVIEALGRVGGPEAAEVIQRCFTDTSAEAAAEFLRVCYPLYSGTPGWLEESRQLPGRALLRLRGHLGYAGRWPVTRFLYLVRHGQADPHDGPLSEAGKEQARLTGQRLSEVPFSAVYHGPLPRAAQTASVIAACLPGVPVSACDLAGDYLPSDPDPAGLPSRFASFLAGFTAAERTEGPARAAAALQRFARSGDQPGDTYELVVTHNFLIGWLVSQALDAPRWRWLGLNQMNCAVTIIAYPAGLPASLIVFDDAGHLPPALRWTGFPAAVRPAGS